MVSILTLISLYSKTLADGNAVTQKRQTGCMCSTIESRTMDGLSCGGFTLVMERVIGGLDCGML